MSNEAQLSYGFSMYFRGIKNVDAYSSEGRTRDKYVRMELDEHILCFETENDIDFLINKLQEHKSFLK